MNIYKQLAENLNRLPEGFTSTESGVELQILAKLFTEEEAALACRLNEKYQTVDEVAEKLKFASKETKKIYGKWGKRE